MSRAIDRRIIAGCVLLLLLAADQISKHLVMAALPVPGSHIPLPGPVDLTLVMNVSNAFGLAPVGEMTRWVLSAVNLSVAGAVIWVLARGRTGALIGAGLACVAAGAIGNAIDRLRLGAVIDFLDASSIGFPWVFNVADVAIDLGIVLVLLSLLTQPGKRATQDGGPFPV